MQYNNDHCTIKVTGFFASEKSDLRDAFMKTSDSLREDFRFAHSDSEEVLSAYKYSE